MNLSNKYYSILTKIGQAQFANTAALGNKLKLKMIKVGDGGDDNGEETFPKEIDTKLVRERWNGAINDLYINPENRNWLVIEAVIPDEVGGFYITEFGLYDDQDNLVAIGKYPKNISQISQKAVEVVYFYELCCKYQMQARLNSVLILQ
ncbi:hypothetical protein B9G39_01880 [Zooshikella ganghwensis]|uniref:Phage tail fibre protein N-terminal domain-containing protein n=1 Tax=Zooshikella ganghwensis TaxID=202772 RepID=A0A4P9VKF2_9GAMM|nr:hypothetical protein B9G39_01880 [Zooshikella ganghwensis]